MVIVLDCNIWISLSISGQIGFLAELIDNGAEIAACDNLRDEITNVLSRPKLSKFISKETKALVIEFYDQYTTHYDLDAIPEVVNDPKDNYLFALCLKSDAAYFVTGDKLLLEKEFYKKTAILNLAMFKQL